MLAPWHILQPGISNKAVLLLNIYGKPCVLDAIRILFVCVGERERENIWMCGCVEGSYHPDRCVCMHFIPHCVRVHSYSSTRQYAKLNMICRKKFTHNQLTWYNKPVKNVSNIHLKYSKLIHSWKIIHPKPVNYLWSVKYSSHKKSQF